jgi:hypothetical protein
MALGVSRVELKGGRRMKCDFQNDHKFSVCSTIDSESLVFVPSNFVEDSFPNLWEQGYCKIQEKRYCKIQKRDNFDGLSFEFFWSLSSEISDDRHVAVSKTSHCGTV